MINFGTGGFRAIIGEEFTKQNIQKIALAIVQLMQDCEKKEIVIGYDRRFLSKEAAYWFIESLASKNIKSYLINKSSPTPIIMFATKKLQTDFGFAITASHNPAIYNGIKVFSKNGIDANIELTEKLTKLANAIEDISSIPFDQALKQGLVEIINPSNDYIDSILNILDLKAIRDANLKILVDPMYGVSKTSLTTILATTRCEFDLINTRHDTLFGGKLPSPSSDSLHKLMDLVRSKHFDLGIATDGDADRLGIVDELGNFVHPNTLLCLLYYYLLEYKKWSGAVVRNLSTTHMLDRIAEKYHQKCIETPVGFKHISNNMQKHDAIIGGESSGGLTVKGHIQGKDGIYAASLLLEMVSVTKKSIHQLVLDLESKFGKLAFSENAYTLTEAKKLETIKLLFEDKQIPSYQTINKVSYFDGLKITFEDDSWISVRFSGTEPLLRIFSEAKDERTNQAYLDTMLQFLDI